MPVTFSAEVNFTIIAFLLLVASDELSLRGVEDVFVDDIADFRKLFHQMLLRVQPAASIHDDKVGISCHCRLSIGNRRGSADLCLNLHTIRSADGHCSTAAARVSRRPRHAFRFY
jgi:hypothetical protein